MLKRPERPEIYGCEINLECDFMSWQKLSDKKCPVCGSYMVGKGQTCVGSHETCGLCGAESTTDD